MRRLGRSSRVFLLFAASAFLGLSAVARGEDPPGVTSSAPARPDSGTKDRILQHIGFSAFIPEVSSAAYRVNSNNGNFGLFSEDCCGRTFYAVPHIPSGALLTYLELDYCDTQATTNHLRLALKDCNYLGADCHELNSLSSANGSAGCSFVTVDLSPNNYTMNNNARELILDLFLHAPDDSNRLLGAYIGYKLQVSTPAPGTQTFGDVSSSHLYYRAIEALAASGITSGCGSGNFCPGGPVTRGEMAAFLARALGLHFPN